MPEPAELPASTPAEFTSIITNVNEYITATWTGAGTLEAASSIAGPWDAIDGATSPYTFTPAGNAWFGRIRSGANSYHAIWQPACERPGEHARPLFFAHS